MVIECGKMTWLCIFMDYLCNQIRSKGQNVENTKKIKRLYISKKAKTYVIAMVKSYMMTYSNIQIVISFINYYH